MQATWLIVFKEKKKNVLLPNDEPQSVLNSYAVAQYNFELLYLSRNVANNKKLIPEIKVQNMEYNINFCNQKKLQKYPLQFLFML